MSSVGSQPKTLPPTSVCSFSTNSRSALERLEPSERDRYLGFAWNAADFPGGPTGPNEARAEQMFAALTRLRPERRANQGETAAVRASEFDAAMQARMRRALIAVPGEQGMRLHRDASASYVQMRTAASADGVTLAINNAYRAPAVAQANAARADNRLAVAAFSSHTLGLAIDLNMSHGGLRFAETSTRPFPNLVGMYASPVYKWMFLRGESHGWFPYRREPWHWEYNPPGLRERLRATPSEPASAAPTESDEQAVSDPIAAIRPPLAIKGSVGRGGRNAAADVLAVQQRLVELHLLEQSDAAAERPSGQTAEASLPRTIEAIERFQGSMGIAVDGKVDVTSPTRTDLDRAIPSPTAADFTAVAAARSSARVAVSRGLTLTGPVGSTASGNAPGRCARVCSAGWSILASCRRRIANLLRPRPARCRRRIFAPPSRRCAPCSLTRASGSLEARSRARSRQESWRPATRPPRFSIGYRPGASPSGPTRSHFTITSRAVPRRARQA